VIRGDFSAGTKPINSTGIPRLGNMTFQASTTIIVASSNYFGGGCGNGLLLALSGDSLAVATEDDLAVLVCGAEAICDCVALLSA
jgi:hypothetical protein